METRDSSSASSRLSRLGGLGSFLLSGLVLWNCHVRADDFTVIDGFLPRFWERLQAGPHAFNLLDKLFFGALMLLSFEVLDYISKHCGFWIGAKQIPVRGKHLDDLSTTDRLFIAISKASTGPFVYFYFRFAYLEPNIVWDLAQLSFSNTALALAFLFIIYDFFYTLLHWALHVKSIYGYVHKHHHRQLAPSRGNVDAVNVHPLEYFLGEYNHLLALFLCCRFVLRVHVITSILFLAIGGLLAGINHTRFDIVYSIGNLKVYDSKAHDVHHRIPQSNYGQYTMLWDTVFGTYRKYNPDDRVNPDAQLDPTTGKSLSYDKKGR